MMLVEITGKKNEEQLTTSSRKVADAFEKEHDKVIRDIESLIEKIPPKLAISYFIESSYKDSMNRFRREYLINRDGFSLLVMGFTGEKALKFKIDFIHAFNVMEKALKRIYEERRQWEIEREKGKLVRHILTDTIKMKVAESPNKRFMYPNYTKLIYKTLFGKSFHDLKEQYRVKGKESLRDYISSEELKEVEQMEMLISSLINLGWGYERIKTFITQESAKKIAG
ncbi:MAG: Rha family transcriptional regulator [Peptostreptococcaceae bacterium]|nr:Rha family transcriptional regulator [Peptostreptococcaceae bacterium]